MKASIFFLFVFVVLQYSYSQSSESILGKTSKILNDANTLEYSSVNGNYNSMTGELNRADTLLWHFSFIPSGNILDSKYLISKENNDYGFNGKTTFFTDKDKSQLVYRQINSGFDLMGMPHLLFSIQNLRELLPQILNDTAISITMANDTVVNSKPCYQLQILLKGKGIDPFGKLVLKENDFRQYELMINKKNFLPQQFINYTNENLPVWIVTYDNYKINIDINDSIFDYQKRDKNYLKYTVDEYRSIARRERELKENNYKGLEGMDWTLPGLNGDSVQLSKINSNLVLLEFWFPGCGGCIQAIPDLNEIHELYYKKGLRLYGLEFQNNSEKHLVNYVEKVKIEYPTLYSAKEVANSYGVYAGPSLFLIDKNGKIVYSSIGFRKSELIQAIEKNI